MSDYVWADLIKFAQAGEQWVESEASHVAALFARKLHSERVKANEAAASVAGDVVKATEQATAVVEAATPTA